MTLTRFFTHYVYIPLGGSRKGKFRTYLNTMIVFLLSGIWHGANWTFVLWGLIHGVFMTMEKVIKDVLGINKKTDIKKGQSVLNQNSLVRKVLAFLAELGGHIYVFIFVNMTWVVFRANSMGEAKTFWHRLTVKEGGLNSGIVEKISDLVEVRVLYRLGMGGIFEKYPYFPCVLILAILLVAVWFMRNTQEKLRTNKYGATRSLIVIALIIWSVISLSDVSEFLYFNF